MDFVIEKSKWLRGTGQGVLLDGHGKMCCLGFVSLQLGCSTISLLGINVPCRVNNPVLIPVLNEYLGKNSQLSRDAIQINDDPDTTDEVKMWDLVQLFKTHGHNLIFKE